MEKTLRPSLIFRDGRLGFPAVLLSLPAATACGKGNARAAASPPAPEVRVAPVLEQDVLVYNEWGANVQRLPERRDPAPGSGYITMQSCKEGPVVRKGQVLFEIDPRPFCAALDRAKGDLAQAQHSSAKALLM
jgi:multidrug efflux pump subunit AcrA (membrane-fusion protein)